MNNNEREVQQQSSRLQELVEHAPGVTKDRVEYVNRLLEDGTIKTPEEFLSFFGGNESVAKRDYTAFLGGHGGGGRVRDIMNSLENDETKETTNPTENISVANDDNRAEIARIDDMIAEAAQRITDYAPTVEEKNSSSQDEKTEEDQNFFESLNADNRTRVFQNSGAPTGENDSALAEATNEEFQAYQRRNGLGAPTGANDSALAEATDEEFQAYQRRNGVNSLEEENSKTYQKTRKTSGDTTAMDNANSDEKQRTPLNINTNQTNTEVNQTGVINQNGGINFTRIGNLNIDSDSDINIQELENSDPRNVEYQRIWDAANAEYEAAQARVQASIDEMQRIFDEERRIRTEEGPFSTVEELDNFTAEYMRQKVEEDERLTNARSAVKIAENKLRAAERRMHDYALAKEEAAKLGIPVEEYEKIRKTAAKKDVLQRVYDERGMGEVTRRTREGKEQADLTTEEIINLLAEKIRSGTAVSYNQDGTKVSQNGLFNQNGGINIIVIDTVNINYGQGKPIKLEGARSTTMSSRERDNVKVKVEARPRIVPRNGNEPKKTNPGPGPRDMMMDANINVNTNQTNTNVNQNGISNQNGGINIANIGDVSITDNSHLTSSDGSSADALSNNDEISYGFNEDGRYRLKKEDIIQDDLSPSGKNSHDDNKSKKNDGDGKDRITDRKQQTPVRNKRGLLTIMDGLTSGLELGKKDGKRYRASNIKVVKGFSDELHSGNYLYNIVHAVPAIVKLPINLLRKTSGKLILGKEAKRNIAQLQERINNLNEEDLMTIYEEYRGNRVIQERFPTILNTLLEDRIQKFALEKVTCLNTQLEVRYQSAFSAIRQLEAIDAQLANPSLDNATRNRLTSARTSVFNGQAGNIAEIRKAYIEANGWLSGGAHGFSEDMKAATTKLSCIGKRFAKDHDLDGELLHRQAQLEQLEMRALAAGDNETALRVFVESEKLLSDNTEINGSLFGKRSTGKKYYSPLVEQLDYRDDPFLRDLFTTIAVTSAAISATKALEQANNGGLTSEQTAAIQRNEAMMQQVNQYGKQIADSRGVIMKGMEAQNMQDVLNASNEVERATLDTTNWGLGTSAYRAADDAGHAFYNDLYSSTEGAINAITSKYAQGVITQSEAMDLMAELSANSQATLQSVTKECLEILKPYAATHPQFDLTGVQNAMEYMVQNPTAIAEMNQAMVDATAIGDTLSQMQLEHIGALQSIPSNVQNYFLTCASSAALAANVANAAQGARKHKYGNNVTDMVNEYSESVQAASQSTNTRGR